jgi:hypothetical protein
MEIFTKTCIIFFLGSIMIACTEVSDETKNELSYLTTYTKNGVFKTEMIKVKKALKHENKDTLLFSKSFLTNNIHHEIRKYTNLNYSPIDGEIVLYEVDNLGVIFSCNLSWNTFKQMKSSNDSINEIINIALQNIIRFNDQKYLIENFKSNKVVFFNSSR